MSTKWTAVLIVAAAALMPRTSAAQGAMDYTWLPVFEQRCAACHGKVGVGRAHSRETLATFSPERILAAITTGPMVDHATGLSVQDKRELAEFVAARSLGKAADRSARAMSNPCSGRLRMSDPSVGPSWSGMSPDAATSARFQSTANAGLTLEQVPRLRLKWAFGLPEGNTVRGQPTVAGGRVFLGSDNGMVYAVDAKSGCVHWSFEAATSVVTAVSVGKVPGSKDRYAAYFGDWRGRIYAVDAQTGTQLWTVIAEDHPMSKITGSPVLDKDGERLYVPVGSFEEASVPLATYECCTFQGLIAALDAKTGQQLWKSYTIPERPRPIGKNAAGTQLYGPAGSGVWVAPTIDYQRKLVYIGTSNAYNDVPDGESSDAVIAFDLDTGKRKWSTQLLANDSDDVAETNANDDVSGSVVINTLPDGRQLLIAGQELGRITALDPDRSGAIVWIAQAAANKFAPQGGGFGSAADGEHYYRPQAICSPDSGDAPEVVWHCQRGYRETGLMVALRAATGEVAWTTPIPRPTQCADPGAESCSSGLFGAATVIPGAVFSGSRDGTLRAYSAANGKILWEFPTMRDFETVNGVKARGGSISGHGPAIVGGMLFMGSGYNILSEAHGNVLLAFGVE